MKISKQHNRSTGLTSVKRFALPSTAGLALLLAPLSASAQPQAHDSDGHRPPRCLPAHVQKQLPLFDTNKNGRLDPEEHHAMREAEREADLKIYDVDGDGRLSKDEHTNLRQGKMAQHFGQLDTDRNGQISEAEATGSCTPIEHDFVRIDSDGNNSITWSEFEKAAPKHPRPRGPRGHHPKREG